MLNAGYVLGRNKQPLESDARWKQSTIVNVSRSLQERNEAKPEGGRERTGKKEGEREEMEE